MPSNSVRVVAETSLIGLSLMEDILLRRRINLAKRKGRTELRPFNNYAQMKRSAEIDPAYRTAVASILLLREARRRRTEPSITVSPTFTITPPRIAGFIEMCGTTRFPKSRDSCRT